MSEPIDILLRDRIAEVFDNYDDNTADAGWALLRERYPEEKKEKGIIWWWGTAAAVIIFAGLFFFLNRGDNTVNKKTVAKIKVPADMPVSKKSEAGHIAVTRVDSTSRQQTSSVIYGAIISAQTRPKQSTTGLVTITQAPALTVTTKTVVTPNKAKQILAEKPVDNQAETGNDMIPSAQNTGSQQVIANNVTTDTDAPKFAGEPKQTSPVIAADKNTDPVLKMMADDKARQAKNLSLKTQKKESLVSVSPYAATYFNYARGSSNQVNVGAGVTTDFKISSRVKFSTGISVAQNTLNFKDGIPPNAAVGNAFSAAFNSAVVSSPAYSVPPVGASSSPNGSVAVNGYAANLIGLDIPINFKYQFNPAKNDTYVSAGISSGTFINETYSTTVQFSGFSNSAATVNQTGSNSTHFGTFDFAKTLNFSFGVGYPLGSNRLIVEPFLKYPLGGLGSQNIRFGASGLNLKLNIGRNKK